MINIYRDNQRRQYIYQQQNNNINNKIIKQSKKYTKYLICKTFLSVLLIKQRKQGEQVFQ